MGCRRCRTVFNITQISFTPEFTGHLIRLTAVLQEFSREAPVTVIFQPGSQSMLVRDIAQAANIFIGYIVGYKTAYVPEEAVGLFLTSHDRSEEHTSELQSRENL